MTDWQVFVPLAAAIGMSVAAGAMWLIALWRLNRSRRRYNDLIVDALSYDILLREICLRAFLLRHAPIWAAWRPMGDVSIEVVSRRREPEEAP